MIESAARNDAFENSELYFTSPWQVDLFAIAVSLCDAGHLDRAELSEAVEQAMSSANATSEMAADEELFAATLRILELGPVDAKFYNISTTRAKFRKPRNITSSFSNRV